MVEMVYFLSIPNYLFKMQKYTFFSFGRIIIHWDYKRRPCPCGQGLLSLILQAAGTASDNIIKKLNPEQGVQSTHC